MPFGGLGCPAGDRLGGQEVGRAGCLAEIGLDKPGSLARSRHQAGPLPRLPLARRSRLAMQMAGAVGCCHVGEGGKRPQKQIPDKADLDNRDFGQ